jgi:hypothetical protein
MVTGGDALVEVTGAPSGFNAHINGQDATSAFKPAREPGKLLGRISGLKPGKNTLEVKAGGSRTSLELTDYPIAGSVFSGRHQEPFVCQTEQAGLGKPLDADCSAKTVITYLSAR